MWDWYEPRKRRPAQGIQAQSKHFGKTWWAGRWLAALEKLIEPSRLQRGRSYARAGQVLTLDIETGRVSARVQGSAPHPYNVEIKVRPLTESEWSKVADAMSAQAIFVAKLLAGEMPTNIEEAFETAGVSLFPADQNDLETECTCPDWANPCKHTAAVYLLLGEQFDSDPFLIFRLRGKTKTELIEMLRARRGGQAPSPPKPRKKKQITEHVPALTELLDHFWTESDTLDDFHVNIHRAELDATPVKRLGTPGFWHGKADFGELFAEAYHDITDTALELIHKE